MHTSIIIDNTGVVYRLIVTPMSQPVIVTDHHTGIAAVADALDTTDGISVTGYETLYERGRPVGARVKLRTAVKASNMSVLEAVASALSDCTDSDVTIRMGRRSFPLPPHSRNPRK